jgi:CarD family transcriptional regulator
VENDNERKDLYRKILAGNDRTSLIRMIKSLYSHQVVQKAKGKKLHMQDERFMKEAETVLYDEFAHVLSIKREEVLPFIAQQIEISAGKEPEATEV